jgi:selenocysteine lyase/cysteine desulfurase
MSDTLVSTSMAMEEEETSAYRAFGVMEEQEQEQEEQSVPMGEAEYLASTAALFPSSVAAVSSSGSAKRDTLLQHLRSNLLGEDAPFTGPYPGDKHMVYADWTASGRSLHHIEQYIAQEVLPSYGNTHTTTSRSGHQSTCFRHEARQVVAEAVNAKITGKAALDVVLFTGNGTTSAINKLVLALGLHLPLPDTLRADPEQYRKARPVVFVSSYEHHSNILPWREAAADVVTIRFSAHTGVCLLHLQAMLALYADRTLKIGAFAAASNVTGVLTDVDSVSICMHKAGGIVIFDYATAGNLQFHLGSELVLYIFIF